MKFSQIKHKIKNLGNFKSVKEIKEAGLRIVYNKKDDSYWLIEEEFLKPVIKSPRECKSILIKKEDLKYKVFMCHKSKEELKGTKALDYIKWGEKQGYHKRPTCASRERWWDLGERNPAFINCNYLINEIMRFYIGKIFVSDDFQSIYVKDKDLEKLVALILNSSLIMLFSNMLGRSSFGGGLLKIQTYEVKRMLILEPTQMKKTSDELEELLLNLEKREIRFILTELGFDPTKPIREQEPNPLPDRKALDDIVFDALELTEEERTEVYRAVCQLVWNRIS